MPAGPDTAASAMPRAEVRPINWPVTVIVFFAGSVLLWADRSNFSVAAAAWAKELNWTPSTIGLMLSAFSLGLSRDSADRRLDRGSDRPAAHARRRNGRLVGLGALDAGGADHLVAHGHFPHSARRVRGALHSGEHRRGVACDPVAVAARTIRGLHAVGRAAGTGNGCVLRWANSASHRLAGLHLRRVRRYRPSPAPRCGGSSREILPIRCPRARWRKPKPRSAPRKRRYRRGSS